MKKNLLFIPLLVALALPGGAFAECTKEQAASKAQELSVALQAKTQKDPRRAQEIRARAQSLTQNAGSQEALCALYDQLLMEARN